MTNSKEISRRSFLKLMGAAGATAVGVASCDGKKDGTNAVEEIPTGQMTYRTNPSTGDKVSLLGFGMMRLPSVGGRSAREGKEEIDQEMVNQMVDYAIAHGVNYFDTSPAYCQGKSEQATGIALSRYPRDKYFIATKLSNFSPATWSREASLAMYHNSFKELKVDYIDYMLLHAIGMGNGMEEFESRYVKNGVLDFLLEERKAGRIRNLGFSYHGDIRVFDYLLSRHDEYKWDFVQIQLNYLDWSLQRGKEKYDLLAQHNINILDITQTVLQEYFTMVMLVDTTACTSSVAELSDILEQAGKEQNLSIRIQREDIFNAMHRI
jgi:predicted amino acid-binding ACT domain protein